MCLSKLFRRKKREFSAPVLKVEAETNATLKVRSPRPKRKARHKARPKRKGR